MERIEVREKRRGRPRQRRQVRLGMMAFCALVLSCWGGDAPFRGAVFRAGEWNPARWQPLRLPHQSELLTFVQRDGFIGTAPFTAAQKKQRADNVLLAIDTGAAEGEFEVNFVIGPERGTAPGVVLFPAVEAGVVQTAIGVFVASYTMAVWRCTTDPEKNETQYKHLVRLNRWQAPGVKHTLRCRYSQRTGAIALRIDDSDTLMLRDLGVPVTSTVGLWGCHGTSDYYSLRMVDPPELQWAAQDPRGRK